MGFNTGMFGCFENGYSCCMVTFVPCGMACIQGMAVAAAKPEKGCQLPCILQLYLCCIGGAINRNTIREQLGIDDETCCTDFLRHFFCGPCSVCQEFRHATLGLANALTEQINTIDKGSAK
jgi:Cys-rich protein (TIGR01571 family)